MIEIKIDAKSASQLLTGYANQMPYAIAVALNRTAEDCFAQFRKDLPGRFTFRQPGLIKLLAPQQIRGLNAATKKRLRVVLDTETRAAKMFRSYEKGETTVPTNGNTSVAVPTRLTRSLPGGVIPKGLFPANLGFQKKLIVSPKGAGYTLAYARGTAYKKGQKHGMFEINSPNVSQGFRGVWIRQGGNMHKVWHYNPTVRKPAILKWEDTIRSVVAARWEANMRGAAALAIRTAKKGGGMQIAEGMIGGFRLSA
jgi:hypothetical protein